MDFSATYEIAVAGAGIAGCAAAIQAARSGKKTVLIEKTLFPGGLATGGLIHIYLPLCDGCGNQIIFGIAEELMKCSLQYGPGRIDPSWRENTAGKHSHPRLMCSFSPAALILALDELLRNENVDVWYDTRVCAVEAAEKIKTLVVENESGRGRIEAEKFIDATGSGIVMRRAGVPCLGGRKLSLRLGAAV